MPKIQHVAASDITTGFSSFYTPPDNNSMLIQITDPAGWVPTPKHAFVERHHFEFLDIEANDFSMEEEWKFQPVQAQRIVALLQKALDNNMNVTVHCFAGVSRSGAVAEFAKTMGFEDAGNYRDPNQLVLNLLNAVDR